MNSSVFESNPYYDGMKMRDESKANVATFIAFIRFRKFMDSLPIHQQNYIFNHMDTFIRGNILIYRELQKKKQYIPARDCEKDIITLEQLIDMIDRYIQDPHTPQSNVWSILMDVTNYQDSDNLRTTLLPFVLDVLKAV